MDNTLREVCKHLFLNEVVNNFDYVVQLSMRCFAAGALWRKDHPTNHRVVFTSEVGISRYMDRIAQSYVNSLLPAKILIEDDYLVHGSSLSMAIESFVRELTSAITRLGGESGLQTRENILRNLYARVYMASDNALLLNSDVMERIYASEIVHADHLRESSIRFVRELSQEMDFGCASVLSACWPLSELGSRAFDAGRSNRWNCFVRPSEEGRSKQQRFYRLRLVHDRVAIILRAEIRDGVMCIVPALHHGDMDGQHMHHVLHVLDMCAESVSSRAERESFRGLLDYLGRVPNLLYRVAFADMLIAQIALSAFARSCSLSDGLIDVGRVAEFYGMKDEQELLEAFARISFDWEHLDFVTSRLPRLDFWEPWHADADDYATETIQWKDASSGVVAAGYRLALKSEASLQDRQRARAYPPRSSANRLIHQVDDVEKLNPKTNVAWADFVMRCIKERDWIRRRPRSTSLELVYASIYTLMDQERLSMRYAQDDASGEGMVSQVVGPTEMSLSILPSVIQPDIWQWFKDTVRHCRLHGLSILETIKHLGYNANREKGANALLKDAAEALEERRYLDEAVLDWKAGVSFSDRGEDARSSTQRPRELLAR